VRWVLKVNGILELEAERLQKHIRKKDNKISIYGYPYMILRIKGEVERIV
jgi:hypothetical protein